MGKLVVIEGPDGSGKTTLCKYLCEELGLEYRRYPGLSSETGPDDGISEWWDKVLLKPDGKGIYDRCFYISEYIYQMINPSRPLSRTSGEMAFGINMLWHANPLIIFCLPPEAEFVANVFQVGRPKLAVPDELMRKTLWQYSIQYVLWSLTLTENVRSYDYTLTPKPYIKSIVEGYLGSD